MPKSHERIAEEREQRRARIADAAMKLFGEHGFASVSVEQIADASGYTRVSVYNHFRGKPMIYLYLVQRGCALLAEQIERRVRPEMPPLEAFDAFWATFVEAPDLLPSFFDLYFLERDRVTRDMSDEEKAQLQRAHVQVERPTRALFERGIAAGVFRDVDSATAASLFYAFFAGTILLHRTHGFAASQRQLLGAAGHYFVRGLQAGAGAFEMPTRPLPSEQHDAAAVTPTHE